MIDQPYACRHRELAEPDWRRRPGWAQVTPQEWQSVQCQRARCVKSMRQLGQVVGAGLPEHLYTDLRSTPIRSGGT